MAIRIAGECESISTECLLLLKEPPSEERNVLFCLFSNHYFTNTDLRRLLLYHQHFLFSFFNSQGD